MRLEVIRMSAAAAADPAIGINAMIDALPIDAGDDRPSHVSIYNQVDNPFVARRAVSKGDDVDVPAVVVMLQPSTVQQVMTSVRDAQIPVVFAYLDKNPDSAETQRRASYVTRALLRFLRRFADNGAAALRTRNGVQMLYPTSDDPVRQGEAITEWDKVHAIAATEITWLVRETNA